MASFDKFRESSSNANAYPSNLLRTEAWPHELRRCREELEGFEQRSEDDPRLFDDYSSIYALDYLEVEMSYRLSERLADVVQLKQLANIAVKDLIYRYIFIHAKSSRRPLGCSKEQLLHILTHYQIMTPFLAHVLTFCQRDEPYDQATFNSEDYLSPGDEALRFDDLGRSGLQIQHCFNLIGVEQDPGEPWPYLYRQSAVYFSFDPIQNRSLCLILKANKELRKRIEEWTRSVCPGTPLSNLSSLESSFSSTLNTHSIIIQWSLENWASYIGFLEAEASESSSLVKYTPVDCITQEHNIHNDISRRSTFQSKSQTRKYSRLTKHLSRVPRSQSWKALVEVGRMLQEVGKRDKPNGSERLWNAATLPTTNMMDQLDINQIFTFQQLQDLHQLSAQVDKAIMILGQNKSVLSEMVERFESLEGSKRFSRFVNVENTNIKGFFRRSRKGLRDLANQEARLRALQAGLDKDISLFNGILQYKNMRTGEYFAQHAKTSTDKMSELTVRTKQETVSIHVITVLTLIFLPGTFVAVRYGLPHLYRMVVWVLTRCQTFFSSNVIDFKPSTSLGGWSTNWGALKLFGIVCGPLMAVVLSAWALTYCLAARHYGKTAGPVSVEDEEKGS